MRHIIFAILSVWLVGFAIVDEVAYYGRYRQAIVNRISYQAYRAYAETVFLLDRLAIQTAAAARNGR
jgi:hypothetical protein